MESGNDSVLLLLWDFPLAPDEGDKSVELQQDGLVLLKSEFQQFRGKAVRPHYFRICHCLHHCSNLFLRAFTTGCCGSFFGMSGSSMSDFAFSSERKNHTHLSRIRPCFRTVDGHGSLSTYRTPCFQGELALQVLALVL